MWPQPPAVALTNPLIPLRVVGAATLLLRAPCRNLITQGPCATKRRSDWPHR